TYHWSNNTTNDTAFGLAGGAYNVNIKESHGCTGYGSCVLYTACDNIVMGKVYEDPNLNCTYDAGDVPLYRYVYISPGNYGTWTNSSGNYALHVPLPGTYSVYVSNPINY